MTHKPTHTISLAVISLGCAKNLADTEAILAEIDGVKITNLSDSKIVLLNTCGFLASARKEVFDHLKKLKNKKVILVGCMARTFSAEDLKKYPQIFAIVSSANYSRINNIAKEVASGNKVYAVSKEPETFGRFKGKSLLTPASYAYVKIAEGCDNKCSYCLIPSLKGRYRSRPVGDILNEIKNIVSLGVKEIILVAQDCGCYGKDLYGKPVLDVLLRKISKIAGDFWVRVLYVYPERINEKLLNLMASSPKICRYLDIPLQHGDPDILKKMYRFSNVDKILEKIKIIRKTLPGVTLRTSIITGFPGETITAFNNLIDFIKKIDFDHLGVFEYSREKGTPAYSFKPQIPAKLKHSRRRQIMLLQQKISLNKNRLLVGKTFPALIENYAVKKNLYIGRTMRFAPEVDGLVYIKSLKKLQINTFHKIKITSSDEYDLTAVATPTP